MEAHSNLYADFQLTVDNCELEPIHRPRAIEGHGHLLVWDQKRQQIIACSEKLSELFKVDYETLWQPSSWQLLPKNLSDLFSSDTVWEQLNPIDIELANQSFFLIGHQVDTHLILELEPSESNPLRGTLDFRITHNLIQELKTCYEFDELFQTLAKVIKDLTGFDRAMVYRFDHDGHGEIVGEAKETHLEAFLGLHYPASDIPPISRRLLLTNPTRTIPAITRPSTPLYFHPALPAKEYVDLSGSQLRATSPIHIEYLSNMGVKASFTQTIIIEGKLWGLISCHHYADAHFLNYPFRKTIQIIASLATIEIERVQKKIQADLYAAYKAAEKQLYDSLDTIESQISSINILGKYQSELSQFCHSDGITIITDTEVFSQGLTPKKEMVLQIQDWLVNTSKTAIYSTYQLVEDCDVFEDQSIGGMLSCCISSDPGFFVMWFRSSEDLHINWGGNPKQGLTRHKEVNGGGVRLSPRKSFAKWQATIKGQSKRWMPFEIDMIHRLRDKLIRLELNRSGQEIKKLNERLSAILNKEFEKLIYIASHDLQEPLRTITNYTHLLQKTTEGEEVGISTDFLFDRIWRSTHRMQSLIHDLLSYSRSGRKEKNEQVNLNLILEAIEEDLSEIIAQTGANIKADELPIILGNTSELRSLFQNLIHNAIKYRHPDRAPLIKVSAKKIQKHWQFSISDNGIGIIPEHFEKIFLIFQRLHSTKEYEGTGIGLAQVKKIVEAYRGQIWVESKLNEGSTFFFTLNEEKSLFFHKK